jgi:hypothetical protein
MKVGTSAHRDLFCRSFIAGHQAFDPRTLPWPHLEPIYLERLRAIPFWGIAKAMERKAGIMVAAFAQTLADPLIREAVALQGVEETRHAEILSIFTERYGLGGVDSAVPIGTASKAEFVTFGYEECVDFFMGAALFRVSRQVGMFPDELVNVFERILIEEARHVTFFINWFRYEEARAGRDGWGNRHLTALKNYFQSIRQLIRAFSGVETTGFVASGARTVIAGITPMMFLEAGLAEHRRMLDLLDPRLIKPGVLPTLAATALTALRALPPRAPAAALPIAAAAIDSLPEHSVAA